MTRLTFLFCFLFTGMAIDAQVKFTAHTSVKNISTGQIFEITYSLEGGKMQDFRKPDFKPLKIVGGPSQSSQTTIINGHMTSKVSYSYSLMAQKEGQYTIGLAEAQVQGKWYKSNPLKITIKKPTDISRPDNLVESNDVFITMEISTDTAYVGQQVIVDYVLFSNVQTRGADLLSEPAFSDFYVQHPRLFPRHPKKVSINDRLYESKIIRRISLFPQFPGTFTFEEINARVRVLLEGSRRSVFSFFERTEPIIIQSPRDTLTVYSVPDPIPAGYTGAVGEFNIKPTLNKTKIAQAGAFSLRLDIQGNGDSKKIRAPELPLGQAFTVYDSKLLKDEMSEMQGEMVSSKIFEYIIVPNEVGKFDLPLTFSYFSPEDEVYVQGEFLPLTVEIIPGKKSAEGEAILYDENLHADNSAEQSISPWLIPGVGGALLLGTLAFLFIRNAKEEKEKQTVEINWDKRAKQYLVTAKEKIEDLDGTLFYESLRQGVYGYVAQKLNLSLSELTKQKVLAQLREIEVGDNTIHELNTIISSSEMALFAGVDDTSKRQELYDQSIHTVASLERYFNSNSTP